MKDVLQIAGISKQAYYQHIQKKAQDTHNWHLVLVEVDLIREEHPGCGVEKMFDIIKPACVGRDVFCSTLIRMGYRVVQHKNFIRTTISSCYQYQNLIEGMEVTDQDQVWQSDITYFKVGSEFYYLVFIIDIFTKEILGYQASDHMRASANLQALKKAIQYRGKIPTGLIHHSDRGSQYGEKDYIALLKQHGIQISMGKQATDNAYAERVNGIIKNEYLKYWSITTLKALQVKLRIAVINYNTKRPHRNLPGKEIPEAFAKKIRTWTGQRRPAVIVYTINNAQLRSKPSQQQISPGMESRAQVCPVEIRENSH